MKKFLIALLMMVSSAAFAATDLTPENYEAELTKSLDAGTPVVIEFYADWCGYCQIQKPMYAQAEKSLAGKANFYRVNVDSKNPMARQIDGIPTIIVLKSRGSQVNPIVGAQKTQQELEAAILERLQ